MNPSFSYLDGNAAAGPLADILAFDITTAIGQCAGCHDAKLMAESRMYPGGPGLVLRCPSCDHVLLRLVVADSKAWLELTGLASLQIGVNRSA